MVSVEPFGVRPTGLEGLVVIDMKQVTDDRGTVREFYRQSAFSGAGLAQLGPWVQVNVTTTRRGGVRGMHGEDMHKLVAVAGGEAFGAFLDARPGSSTYGAVETVELVPGVQVLVPPGVCNGFQALSDPMQYVYCFDREWQPGMEGVAVCPLDPALGIAWPLDVDPSDPSMISAKDRDAPRLSQLGGVGG
jgi:dTDP-4-dehydrorhamnose 3,5-epimerase